MIPALAVIELNFDPLLHLGGLAIRWETIGVTLALLVAFAVAALLASETTPQPLAVARSAADLGPRFPEAPVVSVRGEVASSSRPLRLENMVLIIGGIVPGAVIGGRLFHALAFWDAYAAAPLWILDPAVGSLSLLGAVLGGLVSGVYVARLVGAPVRRWADAAAVPLLLAIGLGKLAILLGGSGQGLPFGGPWAVAFGGPGPWISANPEMPAHPAQLYEALWALIGIPIAVKLSGPRRRPTRVNWLVAWADRAGPEGRLFATVLSWFLIGRVIVGFTWRDDGILGPLNAEQLLALLALLVIGVWIALGYPGYRGRMQTRSEERVP